MNGVASKRERGVGGRLDHPNDQAQATDNCNAQMHYCTTALLQSKGGLAAPTTLEVLPPF